MNAVLPEPMPDGFTLLSEPGDAVVIEHRRSGAGGAIVFVFTFLGLWLMVAVMLAETFRRGQTADYGTPIPSWLVVGFWGAGMLFAHPLLGWIFSRRVFRIDGHQLVHEQIAPLSRQRQLIPRESVQALVQTSTRDEEGIAVPDFWGLRIETTDGLTVLLYRHQYEKSEWLGQVLAQWAEVAYVSAGWERYRCRPPRFE